MLYRFLFTIIIALSITHYAVAQAKPMSKKDYIEKYKELAISEMERSGIPASISLAQGIVESSAGNSRMARESNNHFGIKCKTDWTGDTFYIEDDDYDAKGNIMKSCFRKYPRAEESYLDHTDYLANTPRYKSLFEYESTDYESWAQGLKKLGYATNPQYADMLIRTVKENDLGQFDRAVKAENSVVTIKNGKKIKNPFGRYRNEKGIFVNNSLRTVVAQPNETALELAARYGVPYSKLLCFNDLKPNDPLVDGQYVYLQNKRRKFGGKKQMHVVGESDNMYIISQLYGVHLKNLYKRNTMKPPAEPAPNSRIYLFGCNPKTPALRGGTGKANTTPTPPSKKDAKGKNIAAKPTQKEKEKEKGGLQYAKVMDLFEELFKTKAPAPSNLVAKTDSAKAAAPTKNPASPVPKATDNGSSTVVETTPYIPIKSPATTPQSEKPKIPAPPPSAVRKVTTPPATTRPAPKMSGASSGANDIPDVPAGAHIVGESDTLFSIAKKYGLSVPQLKSLNNLASDSITLGQALRVR